MTKIAVVEMPFKRYLGLIGDADAPAVRLETLEDDDEAPALVELHWPAEVQLGSAQIPGRLEGSVAMTSLAIPVLLQVASLVLDLGEAIGGQVFEVSDAAPPANGEAVGPGPGNLVRAYLTVLESIGVAPARAPGGRTRIVREP